MSEMLSVKPQLIKQIKSITAVLVALSLFFANVAPISAEPPTNPAELRQQIEQLENEIAQLQSQFADVQAQIDEMKRQLEIATEQYKQTQDQLQRTRMRQNEIRLRAEQVQAELQTQQEIFSARVKSLYKYGGIGYLELLLNSTTFEDFFSRLYYLVLITRKDSELIDKIKTKKQELEDIQAELSRILEEEEQALYQLQVRRLAIQSEQQRLENYKRSLSSDMQALLSRMDELIQQEKLLYIANIGSIAEAYNLQVEPGSVVETALLYLGVPYVWGGEDPNIGFDCSGLVRYVYLQHGIELPHYSGYQFKMGKEVSIDELQPGDLVFFGNPVHHVGIYVGNGYFIHAPQTGDFVKLTPLSSRNDFAGARRIIGYVQPSS